ncbi:serine/threonine protein kinase [Shewanella sp. SNU WT4]|uniref:serine/threonine protein kinase n=1 Tax=Shewanella sp. SNU WT4 TaxID=2590015 RepID=UPI00112D9091|nr:protein kinase [Shewanella sp. SNU WT4]QDF68251.1 serine/threonine protein kinase [Shewanella sp. SNU WT4]
MSTAQIQQFYISEEQSIYLLKANDARKHKAWIRLCKQQLTRLGYQDISLLGKGAYGFVFAGISPNGQSQVFKFSRITLPQHIQDRLEEEAYMLGRLNHPNIPPLISFDRPSRQGILVMARANGEDLQLYCRRTGPLAVTDIVNIARQLAQILDYLQQCGIVHGDIKPSNLVYNPETGQVALIDWGSAVFAQQDRSGNSLSRDPMGLLSQDLQHTNARMGDVYFIGDDQLNGALSNPRFDEQGIAGSLYALASGQVSRFGSRVITALSLGLPKELALTLDAMLSSDSATRARGGDHFIKSMQRAHLWYLPPLTPSIPSAQIPIWLQAKYKPVETVSYSSRQSFLKEHNPQLPNTPEAMLPEYYRNFMLGMGDTEKAFIASVGQLGHYPLVGGIAIHWQEQGVYIDSSLGLFDPNLRPALAVVVNNLVSLAQGINRIGTFKACFFNAKDTLHIEGNAKGQFVASSDQQLPFEVSDAPSLEDKSRLHSYFEDGRDPDENLELPTEIMAELSYLNHIHHTGCIIFEVLDNHMKIHSYFRLLNPRKQASFRACLDRILRHVDKIRGNGVSGFMKLPYKNTRRVEHQARRSDHFYPRNPKDHLSLDGERGS